MKAPAFFLALGLAGATLAVPQNTRRTVVLRTTDGIELTGTFFASANPGPGILLLHQCNRDRKTWTNLATMLAADGFPVLTIDFRGFGESGGMRFQEWTPETRVTEQAKWTSDIDLAFAYFRQQRGVEKVRIGVAGASCGVNQAIQVALRHPEVASLVLLSGVTDERGRQFLRRTDRLPLLASASDNDGDAVSALRWVAGFSHNPANRFVEYKAAGHGTEMFSVEKGLQPLIVEWFERTLRNPPAASHETGAIKPTPSEEFWTVLSSPGGPARARQFFAEAKKRDPNVFLFPEFAVNLLGYEKLQGKATQDAIEVFQLNVDAYPNSANAYDSLADGYAAAGNHELTVQYSRKALELLRTNPPADAERAAEIRRSSEERLKQFGGGNTNP
jgi:pimeloyl-ACP methyl ester carboxylesterase